MPLKRVVGADGAAAVVVAAAEAGAAAVVVVGALFAKAWVAKISRVATGAKVLRRFMVGSSPSVSVQVVLSSLSVSVDPSTWTSSPKLPSWKFQTN